jgi:dihydroorotate dehydrogenase
VYGLIRKALFATGPETAHELALESLRLGHTLGALTWASRPPDLPVKAMGLDFANPVGLAAGMDKNGDYIDALGALGFGFIEVGTVTPRPQPGNPKPRVFRIEQAEAMINRLGFNNKGVDHLVRRARQRNYRGVLGINIGKNQDTPTARAVDDYLYCFDRVYPHADYIAVNVSSPNTPGLRDLQAGAPLDALLRALADRRQELATEQDRCVPIAVKVAPDLDSDGIATIARMVERHRIDGVIACNTTLARPGVKGLPHADEAGGLSGAPLRDKANAVLAALKASLPPQVALIAVGGISRAEHAAEKIRLGADLVQFYTGFVYRGPGLIADCVAAIKALRAAA